MTRPSDTGGQLLRLLILPPNGARRHAHPPRTAVCEGGQRCRDLTAIQHRLRFGRFLHFTTMVLKADFAGSAICLTHLLIEPVVRPAASRNVVTPLRSVRAVPVTRPARS